MPTIPLDRKDLSGDLWTHNSYYPSPEMHQDSASALTPCEDLQTLDRLWVKYSKGKWGFSIQKQIWEKCGSPKTYNDDWKKFGDSVGWRKDGEWLKYKQLTFDLKKTSSGEFPSWGGVLGFLWWGEVMDLFSRAKTRRL